MCIEMNGSRLVKNRLCLINYVSDIQQDCEYNHVGLFVGPIHLTTVPQMSLKICYSGCEIGTHALLSSLLLEWQLHVRLHS